MMACSIVFLSFNQSCSHMNTRMIPACSHSSIFLSWYSSAVLNFPRERAFIISSECQYSPLYSNAILNDGTNMPNCRNDDESVPMSFAACLMLILRCDSISSAYDGNVLAIHLASESSCLPDCCGNAPAFNHEG